MGIEEWFSLRGKTAVVTGASRGIGRAIALALAEAGADVALVQRSGETDVRGEILRLGRRCEIFQFDLNNQDHARSVIPAVLERFGAVDILVNNAGVQRRRPSLEFTETDWDDVMQVNLKAVWTLCQAAGRFMVPRGSGKIINIASVMSFSGGIHIPAYAASKGAVAQLTKTLANEWGGYGVNVNAIAPGFVVTEMSEAVYRDEQRYAQITERIPAGRWGRPEDFQGAAVFLASAASNYVNGHVLTVDGGYLWK